VFNLSVSGVTICSFYVQDKSIIYIAVIKLPVHFLFGLKCTCKTRSSGNVLMIHGCMHFIHLETTSWRYQVRLLLLNYISMWWTSMDFNSLLFYFSLKWLVLIATFIINIFIYEFVIIFFCVYFILYFCFEFFKEALWII
jgi:hypothetical protein